MNNETRIKRMAAMFPDLVLPEGYKPPATDQIKNEKETASREAEAALSYVKDSRKFLQRECVHCGLVFAVNRANVNKCSDRCRAAELEKIGIIWDPSKNPEERWDFKEPLTVPPQALPHLREIADQNVLELIEQESRPPQIPDSLPIQSQADLESMLADLGID